MTRWLLWLFLFAPAAAPEIELPGSKVTAENKLFATLDPSTRRLRFPRERDIIITDTVGFIRELPEDLLHAFRATLEELADADLLLHVVDASNPAHADHVREVRDTLRKLDLGDKPELMIYNKLDACDKEWAREAAAAEGGLVVSALDGEGMAQLVATLRARLARGSGSGAPAFQSEDAAASSSSS